MAQKQTKSTDVIEVVADRDKPRPPKAESIDFIRDAIYTIRGMKVMLDADLAEIYGYTTKAFNQQVKNNIEKFDADFRFQLTKEEYQQILKSKILTTKSDVNTNFSNNYETDEFLRSKILTIELKQGKFSKYLPHVFTEQGVYMLMTVLKGELATQQSKALVRAFKALKDFVVDNTPLIGQHELLQLSVQTTQNTSDIAEIKDNMVTKADLAKVVHDFTDPNTRREYLILNGESVEADIAYSSIYKAAKHSIFVIDNYIGLKTLVLLKNVTTSVRITVFSDNIGHGLHHSDYDDFHSQYPLIQFDFRKTCGVYHDRYIVIDYGRKTEKIYHCGASSKDAGKKVTTITQVTDRQVYHPLVDALLLNPVLLLK
jgi:hypothetical protein